MSTLLTKPKKYFMFYLTVVLLLAHPESVEAHLIGGAHSDTFNPWDVDLLALFLLTVIAIIYLRGHGIIRAKYKGQRPSTKIRSRAYQFWAGWLLLVTALVSPLDPLGEHLFTAHMIQHELLMLAAGPLLIASRAGSAIVLGAKIIAVPVLQATTGRGNTLSSVLKALLTPIGAWLLHFTLLWAWHIPFLFNASLSNNWVHSLQHICFLMISLIFWYSILRSTGDRSMQAIVSLFSTAIHASALGALLTFSPVIWYTDYGDRTQAWGLSPLQDQQLGGLIMWMPAGIIFIAVALMMLGRYLRANQFDNSVNPEVIINSDDATSRPVE